MANLVTNKYFKSKDIRVFPSSFRGTYKSGTKTTSPEITFDPEARLNTEANFILPKANLGKDTYIVQYNEAKNKIAFMLCGYYFEILDISNYLDDIAGKYLGLKLRQIALHDSDIELDIKEDTPRTTSLLDSWETDSENILDFQIDDQYGFTGLKVLESELSAEGSDGRIKLFLADKSVNQEMLLPEIAHGKGVNTLTHGEGLVANYENQTAFGKYNSNKAESLFEIGAGTGDAAFDRRNAFEVTANSTNINTNVDVKGTIVTTGSIAAGGKITSALTSSEDAAATLVTKSYIDSKIGTIKASEPITPPESNTGDGDQYVAEVSQDEARIETTLKKFDDTITSSSKNAPTASAVAGYIDSVINSLKLEGDLGGDETFIQRISEENGIISATSTAFAKTIDKKTYKYTNTAPTVWAVYKYIDDIKSGLQSEMSESIQATVNDLGVDSAGGSGKYLKAIKQEGGKIESTDQDFDKSISGSSTNDNAPTSAAVKNYVDEALKTIWETNVGLPGVPGTSQQTDSLKNIILNATYPIGSIYTHYVAKSDSVPTECPIKKTLGGSWTLIEAGKFLCAATNSGDGIYRHGWGYASSDNAGSADAVLINHNHTASSDERTPTVTVKKRTREGWFVIRKMNHSGVKPILDKDGTVCKVTDQSYGDSKETIDGTGNNKEGHQKVTFNMDHDHTATQTPHTHKITVNKSTAGVDSGTNKNLPPYIAVYMWIRVEDKS